MPRGEVCEVTEIRANGTALVVGASGEQEVLLMTVHDDDVSPGDRVLCEAGFALERLPSNRT